MDDPITVSLSELAWQEISRHSQDAFPDECCGVILAKGKTDRVQRLNNIQNKLHDLDPQTYPRTAAIAYAMDPRELAKIIEQADSAGEVLKAFYHSHPSHEAYFSDEDKAFASPFGEPTFPGAVQIVVSIYDRVVKRIAAFAWSNGSADFVEIPVRKV